MPEVKNTVVNFFGESITLDSAKFFFIFCPNNSGKTVLSQYLASQVDGYLPVYGNNEGQMAPNVKQMMRDGPWQKDRQFDWGYIRRCWESLAAEKMFVEASPPNLIRTNCIQEVFGHDSTAIISICNPYQHVSSSVKRNYLDPINIQDVAQSWLQKAEEIIRIRETYAFFPLIPYEDFVVKPKIVNERLSVPFREVEIQGKMGSNISGIRSGFARAVGFLKPEDMIAIERALYRAPDIMEYFSYDIDGLKTLKSTQEREPEEFMIGVETRENWDRYPPDEAAASRLEYLSISIG
ncbi:MAG: hypothetical protein AAF354_13040 [Pseudomonadota bacterium]